MLPELTAVFLLGLLGSAHCVGMCGGFVVTIAQLNRGDTRRLHSRQLLYFLGKTTTYAVMGAVAGGVGAAVGAALSGVQDVLSIVVGVFLVVVGLGLVGVLRRIEGPRGLWLRVQHLTRTLGRLLHRQTVASTFGLGLVNGLLPCGLVYGVLALTAATGGAWQGAVVMATFGLATIPALYATALTSFLMRPFWRARINLVSGLLVIALGVLTIVRGTPVLDAAMTHLHDHSDAPQEQTDTAAKHASPASPGSHAH